MFLIDSGPFQLPTGQQTMVFYPPAEGNRKVVLSTNICETAVTIDDIMYVIDSGGVNESGYDIYDQVETLEKKKISQASSKQRAVRG